MDSRVSRRLCYLIFPAYYLATFLTMNPPEPEDARVPVAHPRSLIAEKAGPDQTLTALEAAAQRPY